MNTYGEKLKFTVFGESHGYGVGMVLDGVPQGLKLDMDALMAEMARRAPGSNELSTPRKEADTPIFMSGLMDGVTTGAPITAVIRNADQHSSAYDPRIPRPSHADLAAWVRFRGMNDYRGGGHFSGRLTAGWVAAGAICRQELQRRGVEVSGRIVRIGQYEGEELTMSMRKEILDARAAGYDVVVTSDAVGSRRDADRELALAAARQAGALVIGSESVLFMLLRDAKHPHFKAVSALIT